MKEKNYTSSILVVDDDPVIAELLAKVLEKPGHKVQIAVDAGEMFSVIERTPPDLVILDVMLPGANGFDLTRRLKEKEETRDIPIIFMTVKDEIKDKIKAFKLGVVDYLTKPIDLEEAAARINTHLTLRNLQKSLEEKNRLLHREINDRKKAEEALRQSEERLMLFLDSASESTHLLDKDLNIVEINEPALSALREGVEEINEKKDVTGRNFFDVYPFMNEEWRKNNIMQVLQSGESCVYDDTVPHPTAGDRYLTAQVFKVGEGIGIIVTDITDRKKAENQVKASLKEKEILLKEIHHRVKNNLQLINSLLSMQARRLTDKASIALLEEVENRVNSIALIHEKMYCSENLSEIDFSEYIRALTTHLFKSSPARVSGVRLNLDMAGIFLDIDKAIPCALIINELITNSLKYAFPEKREGRISIELNTGPGGKITLTVADDGIGLPAGFDMGKATTLGMQIVSALSKQMHGSVRVEKSSGTKFVLEFQIKKGKNKEAKS